MIKSLFKSLTMRIWLTFISLVVIIILAISLVYLGLVRNMHLSNQQQNLQSSHEMLLQMFSQTNDFTPSKPPQFEANKEHPISHIIILTDENHEPTSIFPLDKYQLPKPKNLNNLASWFLNHIPTDDSQSFPLLERDKFSDVGYLFIISPIPEYTNGDHLSAYFVSYFVIEKTDRYLAMVIIIGSIFIVVGLIVSKIISNYISKPLKQLEAQALKIAHKEWVEPMVPASNDEIGSLINSINFMQSALQKSDQEDRHFLQCISHDLKTPIMVILSHAEAIKDGIYIDSLEHTAEIITNEALNLESKVTQILYYNTLDYALINEQDSQEIDLSRFINYLVNRFKTIRPDLDWQLSLKSIIVCANSERLQVALENILDNQIRYAKTFIRIVVRQTDQFAIIHISNNGPSIPKEQLPNLFKNFYRGDKGKFGLGLAITHKIITFYGGSITAENNSTGVVFKIKIPLATEQL